MGQPKPTPRRMRAGRVHVRQVGGELMVYAEAEDAEAKSPGLARTVFRYPDIAPFVENEQLPG